MVLNKNIFITWGRFGTRVDSLASELNLKTFFIGVENRFNNLILSSLSYFHKSFINTLILIIYRPKVIFITNTQWVVTALNLIYAKLFNKRIILDSHSCAFDDHRLKYPLKLSKYFARKSEISIVTNTFHKQLLENAGAKAIIIRDIPYEKSLLKNEKLILIGKFNLLFICIFSDDEPYLEVIKAAKKHPDVQFYISGNYKKAAIDQDYNNNIIFTGFVEQEYYKKLLNSVDAIMTLTTRENTMQRGGSEAISVAKPLITSNSKFLNEYFKLGTVFVENNADSIANGITELKNNYTKYANGIIEMRKLRRESFDKSINEIKKLFRLE